MDTSASIEELQQQYHLLREKREQAEKEERLLAQKIQQAASSQGSTAHQRRHASIARENHLLASWSARLDGPGSRRATVSAASSNQSDLALNMPRAGNSSSSSSNKKMMRSRSNQTTPALAMIRSISMGSENSMSLPGTNRVPRFGGVNTGMLSSLYQDEPANVQMLRRSTGRLPEVREGPLHDFGQDPMDFLKNMGVEADFDMATSASQSQPVHSAADLFAYADVAASSSSQAPSLISGDESITQPLSRQSSCIEGSMLNAFQLHRVDSTMSPSLERLPSYEVYGFNNNNQASPNSTKRYFTGEDLAGIGGGLAPPAESAEMSRTLSNMSNMSNMSMSSVKTNASHQERRAKEARERQILNSLRNTIAPKPAEEDKSDSSTSTVSTKKDGKVALAKTQYQRPQHPRVHCTECNENPDGFRGQHELVRHISAKHSAVVTKWVCRDPHTVGIPSGLRAVNPLSKCKACQSKKQYGAYYNAAAHLRRTHFRSKPSRNKNKNATDDDRRAGKGGGNEPPMNELKCWMVKIQVQEFNGGSSVVGSEQEEDLESRATEADDCMSGDAMSANALAVRFGDFQVETNRGYNSVPNMSIDHTSSDTGSLIQSRSNNFDMSFSSASPMSQITSEMSFPDMLDVSYPTNTLTSDAMMEFSPVGDEYSPLEIPA